MLPSKVMLPSHLIYWMIMTSRLVIGIRLHFPFSSQEQNAQIIVLMFSRPAAKELEFSVVFIVGCEDSLLPYRRDNELCDIAEERRLFYVGMTRAQERLILTHANRRFLFGQQRQNPPSPFLQDIEAALKELKQSASRKKSKPKDSDEQMELF